MSHSPLRLGARKFLTCGSVFFFIGNTKEVMARNKKESSEVDFETAKVQVDATSTAEDIKLILMLISNLSENTCI
ncbi:hypothetical protein MKX01_004814 [Papaver californicum]|nr:hypothetical protein MKX01_004814 [Papaver californicum]